MGLGTARGRPAPSQIETREDFASALTALRESAGLSVRDLARVTGIPFSTLGGYLSGRHLPPLRAQDQLLQTIEACGVDDTDELEQWRLSYHRVRRPPGPRPAESPPPYCGLRSFDVDDAPLFHGRDRVVDRVIVQVRTSRRGLVMVVGPSGAGKSSVLRAGVLARLSVNWAWTTALVEPGEDPLAALERGAAALRPGAARALLVIDQLEEVFTRCAPWQRRAFLDRLRALGTPGNSYADAQVGVLAGLRADFYPQALREDYLAAALQERQVVVGPMTAEELRSAIVEPARFAGVDLDDALVQTLLRDLAPQGAAGGDGPPVSAHEPGTLPLMSHALLETWRRRSGGKLTQADYLATGGISGAVAASAEAVHAGLDPAEQEMARRLFLRLVAVGEDTTDTRRRVPVEELGGLTIATPVADRFVAARLLSIDEAGLQITHEALITAWPRLRGWLDADRAGLAVHRRLGHAASVWAQAGRDPSLLYRGVVLAGAQEWAVEQDHERLMNAAERDFLATSAAARHTEQRLVRRRTLRLQVLSTALLGLLLVAVGVSWYALDVRNAAAAQRDLATSRQLAEAANRLRRTDVTVAAQLAVLGFRTAPTVEARSALIDTSVLPTGTRLAGPGGPAAVSVSGDGSLIAAVGDQGGLRLWRADGSAIPVVTATVPAADSRPLYAVAVSADGRLVAAAGASGVVHVWEVADRSAPRRLEQLTGPRSTVLALAFSPDGSALAAASADAAAHLWTDKGGQYSRASRRLTVSSDPAENTPLQAVAFSPDGSVLASAGESGLVHRWLVSGTSDGAPRLITERLQGEPTGVVTSVAFSPDGERLAAGSKDQRTYLWPTTKPAAPPGATEPAAPAAGRRTLAEAQSRVNAVAFSPDGSYLVAGSSDHHLRIYDKRSLLIADLPHPGPITGAAFSPDGDHLITGAADGMVRVWSMPLPTPMLPTGRTFSLGFTDDGRLAAVDSRDEAALFDVSRPDRPRLIGPVVSAPAAAEPPTQPATRVRFSGTMAMHPSGEVMATGGSDGSVWLWDAASEAGLKHLATLPRQNSALIESVAFSSDGALLATASDDSTVALYDTGDLSAVTPAASPLQLSASLAMTVAFSPDGHTLAVGTATPHQVSLWDVSDPAAPTPLGDPVDGPTLHVNSVAFNRAGTLLAVGSADRSVRLLDVADPRRPVWVGDPLLGAGDYVNAVAFSPDDRELAAACGDGVARVWDVSTPTRPELRAALRGIDEQSLYSVAFAGQGRRLAAAGTSPAVLLWNLDPEVAARRVCSTAGEPISAMEWEQYLPSITSTDPCADTP